MSNLRVVLVLIVIGLCCLAGLAVSVWAGGVSARAELLFGPPSPSLTGFERWRLAWSLTEQVDTLTLPPDPAGAERSFVIDTGESALSVIGRLEQDGLVRDADAFRDYLVYTGADTRLVPGIYTLSPAMSALDIAALIQSIEATGITFRILPGWRLEEVAAAIPAAGLQTDEAAFLALARSAPSGGASAIWPPGASHEGLLFPDGYALPRSLTPEALLGILTENFRTRLTPEIQDGFTAQGLSVFEAVTLASIVQREAVVTEEMPLIASVFLNRLAIGMKLDADPTVQYALGFQDGAGWWKAPLGLADLRVDNPYNTYLYGGLPPGPIANPGLDALRAVAFPAESGYYYFRAACDGSGTHVFSFTFEEHQQNACP